MHAGLKTRCRSRLPTQIFPIGTSVGKCQAVHRTALGLLAAVAFAVAPRIADAKGWEEVHQTLDDVRLTVGTDGAAIVQHRLRFRIVAGHFKTLDFAGIDPNAELITESTLVPEGGTPIPAHIEANPKAPGSVRIAYDEPRGLGRGVYAVDVSYRLDLVATKKLERDGAMWRLSWTAPASSEGRDGARVVFELPPSPTEPRLGSPEQAATTLATLRRALDKDELELVRAHVPRGEAVTWSARVDPKAFPRVTSPELRPPSAAAARAAPEPNPVPLILAVLGLVGLAGLLGFALHVKQASLARACEARSAHARPLVPLHRGLAPVVFGSATAGGLAALLWGTPAYGAALVVLAMVIATHRTPVALRRPRGPGRWMPIADAEVFVLDAPNSARGDVMDLGTRQGKQVALVVVVALATLAFVLRTRVAGAAIAIPLAAAALVPLFVTGTRAELPRSPAELAARILAPVRSMLGRLVDLAHIHVRCVARFGEGTKAYDEVRLTCSPSEPMPGLRAIELALACAPPGTALPEVLVRFDDGSAAAAKIAQIAPGICLVPGRCPEEKVLRLSPRMPTPSGAARLLARLAVELEGRRVDDRAASPALTKARRKFAGAERRMVATAPGVVA